MYLKNNYMDTYPDNLNISESPNNYYYNTVDLPNNKGLSGNAGEINYSYDDFEFERNCQKSPKC